MSSTYPLQRLPSAQDSLKIPPFAPQFTIPELTGCKRSSSSLHINEAAPTKRVKVGSFNLFSRPSFSESDPYCPEGASVQRENHKQASCQKLIHEKLNNKIISTKGIKITFSNKSKGSRTSSDLSQPVVDNRMLLSKQSSALQAKFSPDLRAQMIQETLRQVTPVNDSKQFLRHLISKQIEENCLTLAHKMQDLLILRHMINPETIKIPVFENGIEDTMPGTPCTIPAETISEVKSEADVTYNSVSPVKSDQKTRKINQEGFVPRKTNKVQVSKEQTVESRRSYFISLGVKEGEMKENIISMRVGEENQVSIPAVKKEEDSQRMPERQIKLKSSPEGQL